MLAWDSALTSDILGYLHHYGMHSFSVFVLTSKDESLPPQPFEIFCAEELLEQHIFCPMQIENLGTRPRSSFVLAVGRRDNLWPPVTRHTFSLCRSLHIKDNDNNVFHCCSSCHVTCWFNSAVAPVEGQLTCGADLRKTVSVIEIVLSPH